MPAHLTRFPSALVIAAAAMLAALAVITMRGHRDPAPRLTHESAPIVVTAAPSANVTHLEGLGNRCRTLPVRGSTRTTSTLRESHSDPAP